MCVPYERKPFLAILRLRGGEQAECQRSQESCVVSDSRHALEVLTLKKSQTRVSRKYLQRKISRGNQWRMGKADI